MSDDAKINLNEVKLFLILISLAGVLHLSYKKEIFKAAGYCEYAEELCVGLWGGWMFYNMPVSQACEQKEYFSNL